MSNYKIIVSDLDGTLLNNDERVSPENFAAIHAFKDKSIEFVPSSGRTLSEIPDVLKCCDDIRFIIYSNGAVIYDKLSDRCICMCISEKTASKLFEILYRFDVHITVRHGGRCYVAADMQKDSDYIKYNVCVPHRKVITDYGIYVKNFKSFCYKLDNIEVISVFFADEESKNVCKKHILALGGLIVADAWDCNIEISSVSAGKGNALLALADMLGVSQSGTIAVGDSGNDITMIESAGLGIAVSNASDSLKKCADEIICSNEDSIASYILTHYINNGKL